MDFLRSVRLGHPSVLEGGLPNVRGQSGFPLRWGKGWLEEVREAVGWGIARKDKAATQFRVELLLKMWSCRRSACDFRLVTFYSKVVDSLNKS